MFLWFPLSMVSLLNYKVNHIVSFVSQLFILIGMSNDVERGRECEAASRAVTGSTRIACRGFH